MGINLGHWELIIFYFGTQIIYFGPKYGPKIKKNNKKIKKYIIPKAQNKFPTNFKLF